MPPLPWRVSSSGPVFRYESDTGLGRLREFTQVGVELLGAGGPAADAEVIAPGRPVARRRAGIADATIRIGHVGLILEILAHTGLPAAASSALVEMLSAAAAEGEGIQALDSVLERLAGWLRSGGEAEAIVPAVSQADDRGVDRLVPPARARRHRPPLGARDHPPPAPEVGPGPLALADPGAGARPGPRPGRAARAGRGRARAARPEVRRAGAAIDRRPGRAGQAAWRARRRIEPRVELDLGFGRGIGFYTQMIFELVVATPAGPVEVCGGGRYDGLARVLGSDRDDRGVGFAFGLERLAEVCARRRSLGIRTSALDRVHRAVNDEDPRQMTTGPIDPIRLALPSKGHLYDGIIELLKTAGYKVRRASDRQYEATIVGHAASTSCSCGRPTS